jgi:hypothetical protein
MVFLAAFTRGPVKGQNELSRLVAVDSIVWHGELHIDNNPWAHEMDEADGYTFHKLIDMVYNRRDGHFYSSKPPVLTLVLAAPAALARAVGADFRLSDPDSPSLVLNMLRLLVIGGVTACTFYVFRREIGRLLAPGTADLVTILALGGTLFLSYSTSINHHTVTGGPILIGFLLLGMHKGERVIPDGKAALAGCLMGFGAVVDIGHGFIFGIMTGLYLLLYVRSFRTLLFFGLGSIPPLALHCAVQFAAWGSILPVQMLGGTKNYPGSYWFHRIGPDAWKIPRTYYWFLTLFSMHGLFVLSPILLVGAARLFADIGDALRRDWRAGGRMLRLLGGPNEGTGRGYAAFSVLFAMCFLIGYYSFRPATHFGGACFGMRWYIGFTPVLSYYAARGYVSWSGRPWFRCVFYAVGAFSLTYAAIGMRWTWVVMETSQHPLVQALMPLRGF